MKILCSFISAILFLIAPSLSLAATPLATINGNTISLEFFNQRYNANKKYFKYKAPTKEAVLDDMIKRELAVQEASKLGLDKRPEVKERIKTVLYHALLEEKLGEQFKKIHIDRNQAITFYKKNPEIRVSHIFVAVKPNASAKEVEDARKRIENIREEYLKPGKMTFAEVAQTYSEGTEAALGGDLDFRSSDELEADFYAAAKNLKNGETSDIVRSSLGFHIIKKMAMRPWSEADQAKIKRRVFEMERQKIFENYMKALRKKAKVQVNLKLIQ